MSRASRDSRNILRVVDADAEAVSADAGEFDERRIVLAFDDTLDAFAVVDAQGPGGRRLAVHPRWRSFAADFQQQLANRYF